MMFTLTRWFFSLPDGLLLTLSGQPQMTASGDRKMDPANQLFLVVGLKQGILALDDTKTAAELRSVWNDQLKPFAKPPLKGIDHRDLEVAVDGATIRVREFARDDIEDNAPALVYVHGGGFTTYNIDTYHGFCEFLAQQLRAKIYSVDYRLAPEHAFPIPLEDCCTAFDWVCSHAEELGIDPARISIGGDSAGGNISAALCLKRRDAGETPPKAQLLIYPTTDLTGSFPSVDEFETGGIITRAHTRFFHGNYVPDREQMKEPYASPMFATHHGDLPPAVVITAGFDPLRDEAQAYAKAMTDAGVTVHHKEFRSLGHGFVFSDATKASATANQTLCEMFTPLM
jgi:acetyl esterase